jgi:DNA polymerase III epsilon subunit-like protein
MSRETFLKSVTVIDTETTHLNTELAEIVELAGARYDGNNWQVESRLLGAVNGIPPEASAKNNISRRMIEGLPTWNDSIPACMNILNWPSSRYWVAHNCAYDQKVLETAWNNSPAEHQHNAVLAQDRGVWICTHRLSKRLLNVDFPSMEYNLSYLRYRLDLPVSDDLPAHRANADTYVCAVLFEFLVDYALATSAVIDGPDLGDQIHALCWNPIKLATWPFGKHKITIYGPWKTLMPSRRAVPVMMLI